MTDGRHGDDVEPDAEQSDGEGEQLPPNCPDCGTTLDSHGDVLVHALEVLLKTLENDDFGVQDTFTDRPEEYGSQSDPIVLFARRYLTEDPDGRVSVDEIKLAYDTFAERNNHPKKPKSVLGSELSNNTQLEFTSGQTRRWDGPKEMYTVYDGLSFTQDGLELLDEGSM